jgi:hypothetical protein
LKPLTTKNKLEEGMNLMVDIGGGTTDFSFFTIQNNIPHIYYYASISKGLNYIIDMATPEEIDRSSHPHSIDSKSIDQVVAKKAINQYVDELKKQCISLLKSVYKAFGAQDSGINSVILYNALHNRILLYSGGGSTFKQLRLPLNPFDDIRSINMDYWGDTIIRDIEQYENICPILSTSYGLSITPKTGIETDENILHDVGKLFEKLGKYDSYRRVSDYNLTKNR